MTTTEEKTLEDVLNSALTEDSYTCYKTAKVFNKVLSDLSLDKHIRPQMVYNYDTNGLIVRGKKNVRSYTQAEVRAWIPGTSRSTSSHSQKRGSIVFSSKERR